MARQTAGSVAVDGDTAVIGASQDSDNSHNSGSAYVFSRSGTTWTQQAKLTASDGAYADYFGISVAVDGDTAVIGAIADDDNGNNSGSAYVFTRSGATWTQQAKLRASDGAADDQFGVSVAVDGDTAVIGASQDDDNNHNSGSAYVFSRSGTTWTEQAKLTASDGATRDYFGHAVAVNGATAGIGAVYDDDNDTDSGSAYVFTRSGVTWTRQAKLRASDGAAGDWFGISVAVDGATAVIGASADDDNGTDSGSAYVFHKVSDQLAVDFGHLGLWYYNGAAWSRFSVVDVDSLATYNGKLVADSGPYGMWECDGAFWRRLAMSNPYSRGNTMTGW